MVRVVEINAIEHLEATRLSWTSLLYETPGAAIFHTLDWLKVYWHHFRDSQGLRVLLVHGGGTVIGILPLVLRKETTAASSVDALTYPTIDPSHFCGPIGPNPTATLMASFRHLSSQSRDWDLLALPGIGEHDHGRTANALQLAELSACEDVHTTVSKVCLGARWTEHLSGLESEFVEALSDLDQASNYMGDLKFERIRSRGSLDDDDQPLEGLVEECFALNWRCPSARRSIETSTALLGDLVNLASRLGMLDLNLLKLEGRLIAFSLNVQFDGTVRQICVGEAAASRRFDPASLLTLRMLQDSFLRRDRCIYFAGSDGSVTNHLSTRQLPVVRHQHRVSMPLRTRLGGG